MTNPRHLDRTQVAVAGVLLLALHASGAWAATPGAECADCHEDTVRAFGSNPHAHARHRGAVMSCESCHPGASAHAQTGDPAQVFSFRTAEAERASETCLECHRTDKVQTFWRGSAHEVNEIACSKCHAIHGGHRNLLARAEESSTCFECHFEVRADVMKRSRHPLREVPVAGTGAKMTCSSCHNPHGGRSKALVDASSINDKCYECHFEKRAPVLWEHSPVKEDCLICHTPHGSSNDKLLVQRIPRLCQECHMQGRHQSGTLSTNSTFAFNRSCLNCHPQIHGSNSPSGPVLQR